MFFQEESDNTGAVDENVRPHPALAMHLSDMALGCIANVLAVLDKTSTYAPYRSGWALVRLFNTVGFDDTYDASVGVCSPGYTSRHAYTMTRLRALNDKPELTTIVEAALDQRAFGKQHLSPTLAAREVRSYLKPEGYSMRRVDGTYRVQCLTNTCVKTGIEQASVFAMNTIYLQEQQAKCEGRLRNGDPEGAITNARTLLEAMLLEIWKGLSDNKPDNCSGDVTRLYKKVAPLLGLSALKDKKAEASLHQVLGGLSGIISGIAGMRNSMSDAHAHVAPTDERFARLVVNATFTMCSFLLESYPKAKHSQHSY